MSWLKDIDREVLAEQVFTKAASEFSITVDSLIEAKKWKHCKSSRQKGDIASDFESVYANVESLASIVDGLDV